MDTGARSCGQKQTFLVGDKIKKAYLSWTGLQNIVDNS